MSWRSRGKYARLRVSQRVARSRELVACGLAVAPVARVLQMPAVDPAADLLALGANSVDIIRIANAIDRELGFRPKVEDAYREPTVVALAAAYDRQRWRAQSSERWTNARLHDEERRLIR